MEIDLVGMNPFSEILIYLLSQTICSLFLFHITEHCNFHQCLCFGTMTHINGHKVLYRLYLLITGRNYKNTKEYNGGAEIFSWTLSVRCASQLLCQYILMKALSRSSCRLSSAWVMWKCIVIFTRLRRINLKSVPSSDLSYCSFCLSTGKLTFQVVCVNQSTWAYCQCFSQE